MKYRTSVLILCMGILLSACSAGQGTVPTSLPTEEPTFTSTPAASPTNTQTVTPEPPTPTPTPDLSTLGQPAEPIEFPYWIPAANFLDYAEETHHIYQRIIHGRPITVAWAMDAEVPEDVRETRSSFVFELFIKYWDIFGGFPYESFTVVIENESPYIGTEFGIGFVGRASNYLIQHEWRERLAHEVFHAWVGNALKDRDENSYDDCLWVREGITTYYGIRGNLLQDFPKRMSGQYYAYSDIVGTEYNIPIVDMPAKQKQVENSGVTTQFNYRQLVYWKGATIAYMIDRRLADSGHSLDDMLRYLYEHYTLEEERFCTQDALQALNEISGEDWTEFFDDYIYGNRIILTIGNVEYLEH